MPKAKTGEPGDDSSSDDDTSDDND